MALFEQLHALMMLRGASRRAGSYGQLAHEFGARLPVLMYHHVGQALSGADPSLTVSPARFRWHLRWLRWLRRTAIGPAQWHRWLQTGQPLLRRPVLLTFDDGYRDVVRHALPLLEQAGTPAHVFLVSGHIGGENAWDRPAGWSTRPLMDAADIRRWLAAGMTVGSHSRTHRKLTTLSTTELEAELAGSCEDLRHRTSAAVDTFAYPHGDWNHVVREQAAGAYPLVFSSEEGLNTLRTDPAVLRRTMVYPNDGPLRFASRVLFGRDVFDAAWRGLLAQSIQVKLRVANSQRPPWRTMRSS